MDRDGDDSPAGGGGSRFSSPDPLTDDLEPIIPSSTRPFPKSTTRGRTTAASRPSGLPPYPRLQDFSDYSLPYNGGSTPVKGSAMTTGSRSSRRPSPRKRTFELDVGDGQSPQRIFVTVEAEEAAAAAAMATGPGSKRGIKRKLFPPSSPTRPIIHGEEITTTSVPLRGLTDDEGAGAGDDDMETPRKRRGRPRKSNGTPMPTAASGRGAASSGGRKRAPTPAQRKTQTQRRRNSRKDDDNVPSSAVSRASDASVMAGIENMGIEDTDATPRAKPAKKPRIRKTPAKLAAASATAAVPSSSQVPSSSKSTTGTGRKRGRPRKALMPDELAPLIESEMERSTVNADQHITAGPELPPSDAALPSAEPSTGERRLEEEAQAALHPDSEDLLMLNSTPTPSNIDNTRELESTRRQSRGSRLASSQLPTSEGDGYADEDDGEGEMHMMMEQPSDDMESDFERADGVTYGRQDTLAHASDFSMIAVESLPSFQASFQADLSRIPSEGAYQSEMGEETNMIINQTLESLRRSTQTDAEGDGEGEGEAEAEATRQSPDPLAADDDHYGEQSQLERTQRSSEPPAEGNSRAWSRSPTGSAKKSKPIPLSRQLFSSRAGKAPQVDDSFSTLPDSLLQAATPRHLPMKQTTVGSTHGDTSLYDDSFSEIPDEVLEAATPKPLSRATNAVYHDAVASDNAIEQNHSAGRSGRLNLSPARLPTPDDTSSSNNGSKRAPEEEQPVNAEQQEAEGSNSRGDGDIHSSPPDYTQSHIIDFGASHMQQEASGTPGVHKPSSQLPPSGGVAPLDRVQSLEPPAHIGRPSLSPIVRVARTLQSVISDRSSPEGRESNLGSPFRSSVSNEPHRQSSVARSPSHNDSTGHSHAPSSFNPISSFTQRLRSSQNRAQRAESPGVVGEVEDPFGPGMPNYTQTESLRRSAYGRGDSHDTEMHAQQGASADFAAAVTSSTGAAPPSDDQMSWAANNSPEFQRRNHQPTPQQRMRSSSFLAAHASSTGASRAMDALAIGADGADRERAEDFADDETEPEDQWQQQLDGADEGLEASRMDEQFEGQDDNESGSLGDDDMDIWDIEASRPTPDEPSSFIAHVVPKPKAQPEADTAEPPRRGKIPSPWRRSSRRLIYKDEVLSPSQIEIEEGAVSEVDDEYEMIPPASRRMSSVQRRQSQSQDQDGQEGERERSEAREEIAGPPEQAQRDAEAQEDEYDEEEGDDYDILGQQSDGDSIAGGEGDREAQAPESDGYSMIQPTENRKNRSPARSTRDDEYSLMAPSDQAEAEAEAVPQEALLHTNTEIEEYSLVTQQQRNRKNAASNNGDKPAVQEQQEPEKGKRKSGFFGGFDILSFFSSPAALPKTRAGETPKQGENTGTTANPARALENNGATNTTTNTMSTIWSNGLFPSIPRKEIRPSPERQVDMFSPGPASEPRSADAHADAYDDEHAGEHDGEHDGYGDDQYQDYDSYYNNEELSPSVSTPSRSPSTSPSRPRPAQSQQPTHHQPQHDNSADHRSVSAAPSTPEQPDHSSKYSPIEQKRNFTPRPRDRQSPAPPSLFAPSTTAQFASEKTMPNSSSNLDINSNRATSTSTTNVNFLEVPQLQMQRDQDIDHELEMEMESSVLTDGTDYERVPPRAKPSQWDRTLSPSKSCFRSPLKPTTPGRVVAFSNENTNKSIGNNNTNGGSVPSFSSLLRNGTGNGGGNSGGNHNTVSPNKAARSGKENSGTSESTTSNNKNNDASSSSLYPTLPVSRWDEKASRDNDSNSNQNIATTNKTNSTTSTAPPQPEPQPLPPLTRDPAMTSFRPAAAAEQRLSPTTWTREHWLRLDALATLRRRDPVKFQALYFHPAAVSAFLLNSSSQTPDADPNDVDAVFERHRLRGKEVAAQGAAILLEAWHLEVVEAFRAEIGAGGDGSGWDDVVIAKRLFALLVGAERRAARRRAGAGAGAGVGLGR
ncbi:hypothetical protein SLS62_006990 [Diatrype stigma]|uniref:Uncharacterized protein n=1 Tax=Diatrype stigma TaxID=117547 RepID=A0AAN9UMD7_9PEZI